ncbi:Ubiquitin fusion degradation protein-2 [Phaffia rhodozyma]|uniref:RING-type E3 ubiquitin transferase n=1 Tax=Phaffia rhodozyma TaxID=264483 RepID=A0A0F7SJJ5_PHARH|nr:Ubiquitin fusion degradation protein-2 [Phaffia rhodozyma]
MADPSDIDEATRIRLKRLERLGASPATSSPANTPSSGTSTTTPTPTVRPTSASSTDRSISTPTATSKAAPDPTPAARPVPPATKPAPVAKTRPPHPPAPAPRQAVKPVPTKSFEQWQSDTVEWIFGITLDRDRAEAVDWTICWLKELSEELSSEGQSHGRSNPSLADRILIARLSLDPNSMTDDVDELQVLANIPEKETIFEYLVGCWKRLGQVKLGAERQGYKPEESSGWTKAASEVNDSILGYMGESLKDPGMFPQPSDKPLGVIEFLPAFLSTLSPSPTHPIPSKHLENLQFPQLLLELSIKFADGNEFVTSLLSPALSFLLQAYWNGKKEDNQDLDGEGWRRCLACVKKIAEVKELAALLPTLPIWLLETASAPQIEFMSLLGPLTRLSVFPREFPDVAKTHFFKLENDKQSEINESAQNTLRATLFSLQDTLFSIYNNIIRSGPAAREKVVEFFANAVRQNEKRSGMRVNRTTVSSDGFMTNLQVLLLRFFEPVMDVAYSKLDKVDPDYYRKSSRINISEETKIRATKAEADEYFAADPSTYSSTTPVNFISDVFFLACGIQHVGLGKTINSRGDLEKKVGELEKELKRVETDSTWRGTPAEAQGEAMIKKLKTDIATTRSFVTAYDVQLLDKDFVSRVMMFQSFVMTWFVRLVDPTHIYPKEMITLPLPDEAPMAFRMLPEFILEDMADYHVFLMSHQPQVFDSTDQTKLITFIITFLSGKYVKNPFVKAKLVEFLAMGCQAWGYYREGVLGPALMYHPLAVEQLVPSLIQYYIDMEATGGHQQFYDKFSMRRNCISVLRYLFKNPIHRDSFLKDSIANEDRFVIFANMHMNDCTFLLEESLTNLAEISAIETEMADTATWNSLSDTERQDKEVKLKSAENQAGWSTDGGKRNINVLQEWTGTVREPFLKPEIVDRLAAMLCFNLANLVGSKMQDLKVKDRKKYRFDPKALLGDLTDIFRNLGVEQRFVEAVAREGRSYRKELFERLAGILQNRAIKTPGEIQQIVLLCQKVEETKAKIEAEEEGDDLPDEFLDPLMYTLMRDPVILPSSKTTIDRSTIKAHLLSDPTDPFNRVPLKLEDCIPNTELKEKIEAYLQQRRVRAVEPISVDGVPSA